MGGSGVDLRDVGCGMGIGVEFYWCEGEGEGVRVCGVVKGLVVRWCMVWEDYLV